MRRFIYAGSLALPFFIVCVCVWTYLTLYLFVLDFDSDSLALQRRRAVAVAVAVDGDDTLTLALSLGSCSDFRSAQSVSIKTNNAMSETRVGRAGTTHQNS